MVTLRLKILIIDILLLLIPLEVVQQPLVLELIIILNNERVLQQYVRRQSVFGLLLKHSLDEALQLGGHRIQCVEIRRRIRLHIFRLMNGLVGLGVGRLTDDHLVDYHSEGPDVRRERVSPPVEPLRRHVPDGSDVARGRLEFLVVIDHALR